MTINKPIPDLAASDLDSLYLEADQCDKRIFSEMRTNLQLVAGQHYVREGSKFWERIRDNKQLTQAQRLKLTKNHLQRVTKLYRNQIESAAPGVAIVAANETELADQKAAELNQSYWSYIKACEDLPAKQAVWIQNFVEIGEVWVKVFWDMNGGQHVAYNALMQLNPETQQEEPQYDDYGQILPDENSPVYGGKIKYETHEAYNIKRDPAARSMGESPYLIVAKLLPKNSIRTMFKDPDAASKLDSSTENYNVYDNNTNEYRSVTDQVMVKEIYWRPAPNIPMGYYFYWTSFGILAQGELPYGVFPLIGAGFDEQTGNPRSHSIIRHGRPAQIEINRCASKIAEHQVTHGDDKVWVQSNTKVSQGSFLPGIRVNTYSGGQTPTVTEGRTGDQYMAYLEAQIDELYVLCNLKEILSEQPDSPDLYTNLFRSFRFKQKFAIYGQKIERFLMKVAETSLRIAKASASDEELVPAIGKAEYINIPEFKNTQDLHYQIRLEPRTDDIESQFGKQITLNHIMQYVGPSLGKEEVGQMIRLSPFLNREKMFQRFTQKYDNAVNDILALDRGKERPVRRYDDHKYCIETLTYRMGQPDFEQLDPRIQELYQRKLTEHEQAQAYTLQEIQRAEAGFIPTGGFLVSCDFYQADPANPSKTKRVRVPSEALDWLIKQMKLQGTEQEALEQLPQGVLADIGGMMDQSNRPPAGVPRMETV